MNDLLKATTLYALYLGTNGPISVRLGAANLTDALDEVREFGRDWYDQGYQELEHRIGEDWSLASESSIEVCLRDQGGVRLFGARTNREYAIWCLPNPR